MGRGAADKGSGLAAMGFRLEEVVEGSAILEIEHCSLDGQLYCVFNKVPGGWDVHG